MSRIGDKIKVIRAARGITPKQLAKATGVSEKNIEEIESGKKVPGDDLLKRISKFMEIDSNEFLLYPLGGEGKEERVIQPVRKTVEKEVQKIWDDAFGSVLKTIPVYDYSLSKVLATRQLPVISNKVEGYPKDKVFYVEIQDNEMIGFRMVRGDIAFAYSSHEVENNTVCLVEYDNRKVIRQIKKLDADKLLLVSNNGKLITETASVKNVKVLARLVKLEIKL